MFKEINIQWVKNVKRDQGNDWAYMDVEIGQVFDLHWSKGRANMGKTDAGKAKVNELILIFQTINNFNSYKKGTYLTHLVTPVSPIVKTDLALKYPFSREVVVVAKNESPVIKPNYLNFHKPNRGWLCDIDLIEPMGDLKSSTLSRFDKQGIVWNLFEQIDYSLELINKFQPNEEGVSEGKEFFALKRHKYYERNSKKVAEKKEEAKRNNELFCEVCGFDFLKKYGVHGSDYIECHHKIPIATGGIRKTLKKDLALVCANCHRMLHRKNEHNIYYSVDELTSLIIKTPNNETL